MADYVPTSPTLGNIVGLCPVCTTVMYRRVNPTNLHRVRGSLEIRQQEGVRHIADGQCSSVNSDLGDGVPL